MGYDLKGQAPAIPEGSLVLITGVNGYIGSHAADQFLQAGYRVRGTARDDDKAAWVKEFFTKKYGEGKIETVVVADMAKEGAFDEAIKGCSAIAHIASDVSFSPDPNAVVPPVLAGVLNAASAASKEPSLKRFVYTSSSVAITVPKPNVPDFHVTNTGWNDHAIQEAWAPPPYTPERAYMVYCASKTQAERELWKFVREQKPAWVLNCVLPDYNMGTILHEKQSASTGGAIRAIYQSGDMTLPGLLPPAWMVDVQDTARLHVAAAIDPEVANERILAYAQTYDFNEVLALLRKMFPAKEFPADTEGLGRITGTVDNERGTGLLKRFGLSGWKGLEESVRENVGV
ncbi:MAG: hypothetical protein Q9202_006984 [Teloschistes flavicans]